MGGKFCIPQREGGWQSQMVEEHLRKQLGIVARGTKMDSRNNEWERGEENSSVVQV